MFVPVVDSDGRPLMPTIPSRARRWIRSGKATPFWKRGLFCVRLNVAPSGRTLQPIAVGIDPGSKKEGWSVKSEAHTYLNIQADAVTWVKDHMETRRAMRRARRFRKTPCRKPRFNRARGGLQPSTKARWQLKLRIARWLSKLFPIAVFVVEDIKARTRGQKAWDRSFSPLEVGKRWFYSELVQIAPVETKSGYVALFIHEMPEVRFDDVMIVQVPQEDHEIAIDPRFVEVCERGTIEVCGIACDKPIAVGARAVTDRIRLRFAEQDPEHAVRLVIRLTGIRRGFAGKRFPRRTREQFLANEAFINSAYPSDPRAE